MIARLFLLLTIAILFSCEEDMDVNKREYPLVQTVDLQFVDQTIEFSGEILSTNSYAVTDYGFVWSETAQSNISTHNIISHGPTTEKEKFKSTIALTAITSGRTYYMRAYIQGNNFTVYGKPIGFRK